MSAPLEQHLPVPIKEARRAPKAFTRLGVRHQRVLALFLAGESKRTIAQALDLSEAAVSVIINNPTSLHLLERASRDSELELKALMPLVVKAVRQGLKSADEDVALRATKAFSALTGRGGEGQQPSTAEDVIARMVEIVMQRGDASTTIRYAEQRRSLADALPDREEDTP